MEPSQSKQQGETRGGAASGLETLYVKPGYQIVSSIERLLNARIGDMSNASARLALRPVDGSGKIELFERASDVFTCSERISYAGIDEIAEQDGDLLFRIDGEWLALRLAIPSDADWAECCPVALTLWTMCVKGPMSWSVAPGCDKLRLDRPVELSGCFVEATPLEAGAWRIDAFDNELSLRSTIEAKNAKEAEILGCRAALRAGGQPPLQLGSQFTVSAALLKASRQSENLADLATFLKSSDDLLSDWALLGSRKPAAEATVEEAVETLGPLEAYLPGAKPSRYSCRLTPAAMSAVQGARAAGMDIPETAAISRVGDIEAAAGELCRFSSQGILMFRDLAFARRGDGWLVQKMDGDGSFFALDKYWKAGYGLPSLDQTISDLQQMELVQGRCACGRWNPAQAWIDSKVDEALGEPERAGALANGRAFDKAWRSYETEQAQRLCADAVVSGIYGTDGFSREKLLSAWLPVAERFAPFGADKQEFAACCARRFGAYDYQQATSRLCEFGIAPRLSALPPDEGQVRRFAVRANKEGDVCAEIRVEDSGAISWVPRGGEPRAVGSAMEAAGEALLISAAAQRERDRLDFAAFPATNPFRQIAQEQDPPRCGPRRAAS